MEGETKSKYPHEGAVKTYFGLERINQINDMRMLELSQQVEFILDHLLVALDSFLQDDLHGDFGGLWF